MIIFELDINIFYKVGGIKFFIQVIFKGEKNIFLKIIYFEIY